jgi:hypothetical protein
MQWLVAQGADINGKDTDGGTALLVAARSMELAAMQWLVLPLLGEKREGADINVKDEDGDTALHIAVDNGHLAAVQWLMAQGADINVKDGDGCTTLHAAAQNGHVAVVAWLVEHGVPMSTQCSNGRTALDLARQTDQEAVVQWLTKAETKASDAAMASLLAQEDAEVEAKGGGGDGSGAGGGKQKKRKNKKRQQKQQTHATVRGEEGRVEAKRTALALAGLVGGASANGSTEQEPAKSGMCLQLLVDEQIIRVGVHRGRTFGVDTKLVVTSVSNECDSEGLYRVEGEQSSRLSCTPSHAHPLMHTLSCTPYPLMHTLSCTPSHAHPLMHTLSCMLLCIIPSPASFHRDVR